MSLIENALAKLRRGEEATSGAASAGPQVSAVARLKAAADVVPDLQVTNYRRISIDLKALRASGYLPEEGLERRFADHYRQLKRPLLERALSGGPEMRLILVSSALPGDGKSFTSINLALSMSRERDISVLLIDADAPKAHISEVLGIRREPGLLDALSDESLDVETLILHTDVRGLEILPAGRFVENATELLASGRMSEIANRVAARDPRRIVLFDSAPLLVSSEARVLLRVPGQVVLVVRAGVTPRHAIVQAVGHVDKSKLQGLVLNQSQSHPGGGYYGYGAYGTDTEQEMTAKVL